jgi:hypothetical protein
MDDVREYGKEEALTVQIIAFETEYVTRKVDGVERTVPRDRVVIGKIGDPQYRQNLWISRLAGERCDDPRLWEFVKPAYEGWKRGEEIVEQGTPLAAVAFVPPKAVVAYRNLGIRVVEALAVIEDSALDRLPLDARRHRDMARKYLEVANSDTTKHAQKLKDQDEQIAELKAQLAELAADRVKAKKAA